jgi:hypothetical protein
VLVVNAAATSERALKLVMDDRKLGASVMAPVGCDSESIAEVSTQDGIAEGVPSITELVSSKLVSERAGAGVIEVRRVLDGRSSITDEVGVSKVVSIFADAGADISDQSSELVMIDGNEVTSATSVGRGPTSPIELFVIAEETSGMIKLGDDDPATSAMSLVGKDPRSVVVLSIYAIAEEASCKTDVADSDPAASATSLVGKDPRSTLELSTIDAIVE